MITDTPRLREPDPLLRGDGGSAGDAGDGASGHTTAPDGVPTPQPHRPAVTALALLAAGAVAGGGLGYAVARPHPATVTSAPTSSAPQPPSTNAAPPAASGPSGTTSLDAASVAARVDPAVVDIDTVVGYQGARAAGTGMVLMANGIVLTNNHVISGATSISVTDVGNGRTYRASVIGYDRSHDVAVLRLEGAVGLRTIHAATAPARVGTGVVGVGNAGGRGGTPSYAVGTVTAAGRTITASDSGDGTSEQLTGLLETDADIVAGDSGGPLVDAQGQVVGMDTAASAGFRFSGATQGYAIPIGDALRIADQIEAGQATATVHIGPTAMLGVGVAPTTTQDGATVAQVVDGGPAARAGIVAGDTIVGVDGQPVTSPTELSRVMLTRRPGTTVSVRYVDANGNDRTTAVHLVAGPPQ